ncbi:DUF3748 domain-containing protein, partial [Klebsiella pneumoniae]
AFNWHPSGEWLGFALEDRIACCHAGTGDITVLTDTHAACALGGRDRLFARR